MSVSPVSVVDRIAAAMDYRSLQHAAIAQNIANRDAQDYQRVKVLFDEALHTDRAPRLAAEDSTRSVSLEEDVIALTTNAGRYSALASALGRYFGIVASITGASTGRG